MKFKSLNSLNINCMSQFLEVFEKVKNIKNSLKNISSDMNHAT